MNELDTLLTKINKELKEDVCFYGNNDKLRFEMIPSSILSLNYATHGGIPVGKIVEFARKCPLTVNH